MDFTRLFDLAKYQLNRYPQKACLSGVNEGIWFSMTTSQVVSEINRISCGLNSLGLQAGDRVAILSSSGTPYWNIADLAMMQLGIIVVPIHSTSKPSTVATILKDSGAVAAWISDPNMLKLLEQSGVPLKFLFQFPSVAWPSDNDLGAEMVGWQTFAEGEINTTQLGAIKAKSETIQDTEIATILYTSGTTGEPKGVMLSHRNLVSNIKSTLAIIPLGPQTVALSFLPLSHVFERMVTYTYLAAGCALWYADRMEDLPRIFRKVRPHFFTAVPRVVERIYSRILARRDTLPRPLRPVFDWAIKLGMAYPSRGGLRFDLLKRIQYLIADVLVLHHIRRNFGGRVRGMAVGAAALQPSLARLFTAAGIPVREGYGLTETSPVLAFNRFEPGGTKFGTVGMGVPGVELRISNPDSNGDGEIEAKGPNIMVGYYNKPLETQEKFTPDGWLRTGDRGRWVEKHFLQITGRISELFKTASGKFISPQKLETALCSSVYIQQAMVTGLNKPYVSALILPDFEALERWCLDQKVHWTSPQFMVHNPKVEKLIGAEVALINQELEPTELIRAYALLHAPWTTDGGELTPTLKLKRAAMHEKYAEQIAELYEKPPTIDHE
jgi:long-chain acyl-CoA synthetase